MSESISIAVTVIGILLELLAVIGLARLMDAEIPKVTFLVCTAAGGLMIVVVISGVFWGIEPILIGCLVLGLLPGTSLAAFGIRALVQRLNRRAVNPPAPTPDAEAESN